MKFLNYNMKKLYYSFYYISQSVLKSPEDFKQHITGYWEISEVILNDGTTKTI